MTRDDHGLTDVPLSLRLRFDSGDTLELPLHRLPCRAVVRSLGLALLDQTNALGPVKSRWTAYQYGRAIRRFALWLDARDFAGSLGDLTVDHLYEFGRREDAKVERNLRFLLLAASSAAGVAEPISADLRTHARGKPLSTTKHRSTPLLAYSAGEYERLVTACRGEITAWLERAPRRFDMPTAVILAYRILIGLELGIPPESIDELQLEDLRWEGKKHLRIFFTKRRATGRQSMSYQLKGRWSGPALLRQWIEETSQMRTASGTDSVWIWQPPDGTVRPMRFSEPYWQSRRRTLLRQWELRDDSGEPLTLDMRRLRTTWTIRKSKAWHGAVTVDPNRTARVEGDHYLTRSAAPDEVDAVVEAAQLDLLRRAETVAFIVADDDVLADAVDSDDLVQLRALPTNRDSWDMFAAFCSNPYESPFNPKGQFCTAAVWSCLVCPLAVITPAKLPALVRLEAYLVEQGNSLPLDEWLRIYGGPWTQLVTRIFPQFSEDAIRAARALATTDEAPLPLDPWEA